jgi:hypothetical protein
MIMLVSLSEQDAQRERGRRGKGTDRQDRCTIARGSDPFTGRK